MPLQWKGISAVLALVICFLFGALTSIDVDAHTLKKKDIQSLAPRENRIQSQTTKEIEAKAQAQKQGILKRSSCCSIISVSATKRLIIANETSTGSTFEFRIKKHSLFKAFRVGSDFNTVPPVKRLKVGESFSVLLGTSSPLSGQLKRQDKKDSDSMKKDCCKLVKISSPDKGLDKKTLAQRKLESSSVIGSKKGRELGTSSQPLKEAPHKAIIPFKPAKLLLSGISIGYFNLDKSYWGKKLRGKWWLPVSDSALGDMVYLEWTGYQGAPFPDNSVPLPARDVRNLKTSDPLCCLTLLVDGEVRCCPQVSVRQDGRLQTSVKFLYSQARYWPKTIQLIITRSSKKWASAPIKIYPKTISHFAVELHPIFSHPRCTTCHSLGDHDAIVAMHQSRMGAANFPDLAEAQPQSPEFCVKCHSVRDWRSPKFVQGLNWGGKSAAQICKIVTGNFIDKNGVVQRPPSWGHLERHFSSDPRLKWALFDGAKPSGDPPTLPVLFKGDFQAWGRKWGPWVYQTPHAPCPTKRRNAPVLRDLDLIQPDKVAPQPR